MSDTELLTEIRDLIDDKIRDNRLWDYDDIAWYCKKSRNTIINDYSKRPDFPKHSNKAHCRWEPDDIKAYFSNRVSRRAS